jgi:TolB-like protein
LIYAFEDCFLDSDRRELRRLGELVSIEPQVFDILEFLVRNRDRVVSKDDLFEAVWNGRIVSESTLTSRITEARQAIGDSGDRQRLIRTISRKGLRFVADVREEQDRNEGNTNALAPSASDKSLSPQFTLALPDKPSIVVLPFANLSGDPHQEYFVDGMVEDITIALSRLPWLFVIGSASAFTYKGRSSDLRGVGADLGVRYVLGGSVRREGNRVRITAQLTDASHGIQIWSDRFEGELDSVFAMQDRVAAYVSSMIAPALRKEEIERSRRKPTENLTAYDMFLRALPVRMKTFAQSENALRFLSKAIELDPYYASAHGLIAWCYTQQKVFGWVSPTDRRLEAGVRGANFAVDLGKNDSEALWMAACAMAFIAGDFDRSLALTEASISLNTNSANAWWVSGATRIFLGDTAEALGDLARARRLDPRDPLAQAHWTSISFAHFLANRYEDAISAADKALQELANYPYLFYFIPTTMLSGPRRCSVRTCWKPASRIHPSQSAPV